MEFLLYGLTAIVIYLFFKKKTNCKDLLIAAVVGAIVYQIEPVTEFPLNGIMDSPRLATLSADTVVYASMMVIALIGSLTALWSHTRSLERMIFAPTLLIVTMLLYSYHIVMINGNLRTNLTVIESILKESVLSTNVRKEIGYMGDYIDAGMIQDQMIINKPGFDEVQGNLNDYLSYYRNTLNQDTFIITSRNALITTSQPYTFAYYEDKGTYTLAIDISKTRVLFESARIQFYFFANLAVLFCIGLASLIYALHIRALKNRRKKSD